MQPLAAVAKIEDPTGTIWKNAAGDNVCEFCEWKVSSVIGRHGIYHVCLQMELLSIVSRDRRKHDRVFWKCLLSQYDAPKLSDLGSK